MEQLQNISIIEFLYLIIKMIGFAGLSIILINIININLVHYFIICEVEEIEDELLKRDIFCGLKSKLEIFLTGIFYNKEEDFFNDDYSYEILMYYREIQSYTVTRIKRLDRQEEDKIVIKDEIAYTKRAENNNTPICELEEDN